MSPIPPMPPGRLCALARYFSGLSATMPSVVKDHRGDGTRVLGAGEREVTFTGSMMPTETMSIASRPSRRRRPSGLQGTDTRPPRRPGNPAFSAFRKGALGR